MGALADYGSRSPNGILGNVGSPVSLNLRVEAQTARRARGGAEALVRGALSSSPLGGDEYRVHAIAWHPRPELWDDEEEILDRVELLARAPPA